MLGKGWRVEDDEVVGVGLHAVEVVEGILGKRLVALVAGVVELHVALGEHHCLARAVDRVHQLCPTTHGIERESASVAEHVEHAAALAVALEQGAVLALVDEEARLLPPQPVHVELEAVLHCHVGVKLAYQVLVLGVEMRLVGQRGLALVIHIIYISARQVNERLCYRLASEVHTRRVGLHHCRVAIDVDH